MPKFLVDVNLPYFFSLWKNEDFIHQFDINDAWPDNKIWSYAKEHQLTIITKDSDFSNKILFHTPPPKVIHVRFGKLKMKNDGGVAGSNKIKSRLQACKYLHRSS